MSPDLEQGEVVYPNVKHTRVGNCDAFLHIKGKINPEQPNNKNKLPIYHKRNKWFLKRNWVCIWSYKLFSVELYGLMGILVRGWWECKL